MCIRDRFGPGLAKADVATGAGFAFAADTITIVNYTGAAAASATLPAATAGTVCVYMQAVDTTGGTNTLTFDAAGTDVWLLVQLLSQEQVEKQILTSLQQVKLN